MILHQSANQEKNLYRACDPCHMHQDWIIEHWEEEYIYIHIWVARLRFQQRELPQCLWVAQFAFWVEVVSVLVSAVRVILVDMHLCLHTSSVSADSLLCHLGKEGSHQVNCHEPEPGVMLLRPYHWYAQETQLPASSLCEHHCEVCLSNNAFPLLWGAKTLVWPFWPYSMQGACWTVLAVPDLLTLP